MTRIVLDIDDSQWKVGHLARVMRSAASEFLSELAAQVEIQVADARPLIVLDLRDPIYAVKFLRAATRGSAFWAGSDVLNGIADQIEAQCKPARIPEPEPGERVTACARLTPDQPEEFLRLRWSKTRDAEGWHWVALATGRVYEWHNLIDPTLIREGVS